ncbi:hypothetical protein PHYC_00227 [Phycisphaerales bacterium]|nr:hypothetical protein PHYC_00227 [Phycisphaerales bacterium]
MKRGERDRFDHLLQEVIDALPPGIRRLLDEVPVVVDDAPDEATLDDMGEEDQLGLLGLHTGTPFTEKSVEHSGELPSDIRLFREAIVDHAGGWAERPAEPGEIEGDPPDAVLGGEEAVREEIRITLLHEIGHQFGLGEDDLERLGYE